MGKKYLGKTMLLIALSAALLGGTLPAQAVEILPNEPVMVQPREIGIAKWIAGLRFLPTETQAVWVMSL